MKTMCHLGYYYNGFVATHTLRHMMYVKGALFIVFMITHILHPSCLCEIIALCISYDSCTYQDINFIMAYIIFALYIMFV